MATPARVARVVQSLLDCCSAPPQGWSAAPARDADGRPALSDLERKIRAWVQVLDPLTDDELSAAALAYARGPKSAFMPAPGELLQLARPPATDADLGAAGRSAWQQVQRVRHRYREHTGRGYQWRSERHEAAFRTEIGPVACAALDCVGGILAVERAGFVPDEGKELSGLESRFVADFRTIAKRAGPDVDRPQVEARSVRAIAEDADLAPDLARRLAEHMKRSEVNRG